MENDDQTPKSVTRAHLFARLEVKQWLAQVEKPENEPQPAAAGQTGEEGKTE